MRFWDSSAMLPLLVEQQSTSRAKALLADEADSPLVWWSTMTECASALSRLEREMVIDAKMFDRALGVLKILSSSWHEIQPSRLLRDKAVRLLRLHPIRAADAHQLAAALIASEDLNVALEVVCFDEHLCAAAKREGFVVLSQ